MRNFIVIFWLFLMLLVPAHRGTAQSFPPAAIRVVMDDNYPPYSFMEETSNLQGILPDQWRLRKQITGTKVNIAALAHHLSPKL